jgi:hypothetical protein
MTAATHWLLHWSLKPNAGLAGMTIPAFAHYLKRSFTTLTFLSFSHPFNSMVSPNPTSWEILESNSAPLNSELYNNNTISEDLSGKLSSEDQPYPTGHQEFTRPFVPGIAYISNPRTQEDNENNADYSLSLMLQERQNKRQLQKSDSNRVHTELEFPLPPPRNVATLPYQARGRPNMSSVPIPASSFLQAPVSPPPLPYNTLAMPVVPPRRTGNGAINQEPYYMTSPVRPTSYYEPYQPVSAGSSPTIWPQDRNQSSHQKNISLSEANDLRAQISYLQEKVLKLEGKPADPVASKYHILYRIEKDQMPRGAGRGWDRDEDYRSPWMGTFTDPPEVIHNSMGSPHLRCNDRVTSLELYLALNKEISFVVFQNFKRSVERRPSNAKYGRPEPFSETILPVSEDLKEIFEEMLSGREFSSMYHGYQASREVKTPYLFVYHNRSKVAEMRHGLSSVSQQQLDLFMAYVNETCGEEYAAADTLLSNGRIRPEYFQYLFKPNEVLVSNDNKQYTGYVAVDWPVQCEGYEGYLGSEQSYPWTIRGQTWEFDGSFCRKWELLEFQMPEPEHATKKPVSREWTPHHNSMAHSFGQEAAEDSFSAQINLDKECAIADLAVFPIKYASNELIQMLRKRGETFWKFRGPQYVSYHATEEENFQTMVRIQAIFHYIVTCNIGLTNVSRPMTDTS